MGAAVHSHVYRWDLDKTYLETDFESLRGLVRSATEPAEAKRSVPGARELVRALGRRPGARIVVVSGSPVQMREVLERKLRLDGVRVDELVLKDSLRHLRRGEVRAVRGQWGHKLPALLRGRAGLGAAVRETLFGDDAEVDALVYSVYAEAIAGRLDGDELARVMEAAGAYPREVERARAALRRLAVADAVERIFIRVEKGRPLARLAALGPRVVPVFSWWQAALVLQHAGHLSADDAAEVLDAVARTEGLDPWAVGALAQDVVRRGHLPAEAIEAMRGPPEAVEAARRAVGRLRAARPRPPEPAPVDWLVAVRSWRGAVR